MEDEDKYEIVVDDSEPPIWEGDIITPADLDFIPEPFDDGVNKHRERDDSWKNNPSRKWTLDDILDPPEVIAERIKRRRGESK